MEKREFSFEATIDGRNGDRDDYVTIHPSW